MEYGFEMAFWPVSSFAEATAKANEVIKSIVTPEFIKQYVETRSTNFPSQMGKVTSNNWYFALWCDIAWADRLFTCPFGYWEKKHLLAMTGNFVRYCTDSAGKVIFQNKSQQNYGFHVWPTSIPFFERKARKFQSYLELDTDQAIQQLLRNGLISKEKLKEEFAKGNDKKEVINRYVCSALYRDVFNSLQLNCWLEESEDHRKVGYERFAVNALNSKKMWDMASEAIRVQFTTAHGDIQLENPEE